MGKIVETFRIFTGVIRSPHPALLFAGALKKVGFHLFQSLEAMSGAVAFFF
jgi:aminoglycoside N3'-acetyltransferase